MGIRRVIFRIYLTWYRKACVYFVTAGEAHNAHTRELIGNLKGSKWGKQKMLQCGADPLSFIFLLRGEKNCKWSGRKTTVHHFIRSERLEKALLYWIQVGRWIKSCSTSLTFPGSLPALPDGPTGNLHLGHSACQTAFIMTSERHNRVTLSDM